MAKTRHCSGIFKESLIFVNELKIRALLKSEVGIWLYIFTKYLIFGLYKRRFSKTFYVAKLTQNVVG